MSIGGSKMSNLIQTAKKLKSTNPYSKVNKLISSPLRGFGDETNFIKQKSF